MQLRSPVSQATGAFNPAAALHSRIRVDVPHSAAVPPSAPGACPGQPLPAVGVLLGVDHPYVAPIDDLTQEMPGAQRSSSMPPAMAPSVISIRELLQATRRLSYSGSTCPSRRRPAARVSCVSRPNWVGIRLRVTAFTAPRASAATIGTPCGTPTKRPRLPRLRWPGVLRGQLRSGCLRGGAAVPARSAKRRTCALRCAEPSI